MGWSKTFTLPRHSKGIHLVTQDVLAQIEPGIKDVENFDSDVRRDMDMALDSIVPESLAWRHTDEGPDDSVSHTKSALIGPTVSMPIINGSLALGTCRTIVATVLS
ncbi:hypothetical protein DL96DRAFT_27397 [Flagelloscypha sp. PMI_526]|nr:hypothetical protein DL96DRAFT_27397 [Flagelloscypha sp. PMI_526]